MLVYSASCNFSFPILYKLERNTGACDVISMDWLLNPSLQPTISQLEGKSGGALESILKSLSSRQVRRPGAGSRLFVQACVLAGCDYAPSRLNGVGLVTAFKLLRDNAHRPPGERFLRVLSSLSKKARGKQDMQEYEELLAKSEAVFYYHPVLDGQRVSPLIELQTAQEVNSSELQIVSDHHPSLFRFDGDFSFLGEMGVREPISSIFPTEHDEPEAVPIAEIVVKHSNPRQQRPSAASVAYDGGARAVAALAGIVNPYVNKRKRSREGVRNPLAVIGTTNDASETKTKNPFLKYSHKGKENVRKPSAGLSMYLKNRQDVRFVKRKFSPGAKQPSYVFAAAQKRPRSHHSSHHSAGQTYVTEQQEAQDVEFDYYAHGEAASDALEGSAVYPSHMIDNSLDQPYENPPPRTMPSHLATTQDHAADEQPGYFAERNVGLSTCEETSLPTAAFDRSVDMPYGNPDLSSGQPSSRRSGYFSAPQSRRVTMENEDSSPYNEFEVARTNGSNIFAEGADELPSDSMVHASPTMNAASTRSVRMDEMPPFGNVDAHFSVDSSIPPEDGVPSPDHFAYPLNHTSRWAEKYSQGHQGASQMTGFMDQKPVASYTLGSTDAKQEEYSIQDIESRDVRAESMLSTCEETSLPTSAFARSVDMSYGNPDLSSGRPSSSRSRYFSAPQPRRVTMENEDSSPYNEFEVARPNGSNKFAEGADELPSDSMAHASPVMNAASSWSGRMDKTPPFGDVDTHFSVDSRSPSEDGVPSPDHFAHPLNHTSRWAEKYSQGHQGASQMTGFMDQKPVASYTLGSTDAKQEGHSIQDIESPVYSRSSLNFHFQPSFKSQKSSVRRKNCRRSATPKQGTITNFFPVKIQSSANEFERFN